MLVAYRNGGEIQLIDKNIAYSEYPATLSVFRVVNPDLTTRYELFFDDWDEAMGAQHEFILSEFSADHIDASHKDQLEEGRVYSKECKMWIDFHSFCKSFKRPFPDVEPIRKQTFLERVDNERRSSGTPQEGARCGTK